jgi:arylformamidase
MSKREKLIGFIVGLSLVLLVATPTFAGVEARPATTHSFSRIPGIPVEFTSLDVYPLAEADRAPVAIFVHGGGWRGGDKAMIQSAAAFREFFQKKKMILVSTNYRLIGHEQSASTTFKDQATDVAAAVGWVHRNITRFGGDPNQIFLVGYSAGAQIAALVGTDERYLEREGLSLASLSGVVAWDVSAYDIPGAIREGPGLGVPQSSANLKRVFGSDPDFQSQASAITFVKAGRRFPPFLLVYVGIFDSGGSSAPQELSKVQAEALADALNAAGGFARVYGEADRTHTSIARNFGTAEDGITAETARFFDRFAEVPDKR